jgi:uncharacterized membrane protein
MGNFQLSLLIGFLLSLSVALILVMRSRTKRKFSQREALRQRLRHITIYDEAKIDRLIEFERDELKRKGRLPESVESLMTRAIERWERDNASAAPLY